MAHLADRVLGKDLYIGGGEDPQHGVPLPLVPVTVHLLLDINNISLLER